LLSCFFIGASFLPCVFGHIVGNFTRHNDYAVAVCCYNVAWVYSHAANGYWYVFFNIPDSCLIHRLRNMFCPNMDFLQYAFIGIPNSASVEQVSYGTFLFTNERIIGT